eukprot:scaffold5146_cov164-Ochromonas_danica.AAC.3
MIGASAVSFSPELGRKGKEGYLQKSSGGYKEKFSRKTGDYFQIWSWRWFVLQENGILWFKSPQDTVPLGMLQIDQDFEVQLIKRIIRVNTGTRNLVLYAPTQRQADSWAKEMKEFYASSCRVIRHPFESSFPPRANCDVRVYTVTKEYMHAVALAMLGAQREILITSWKMSPHVLLTRPPLPPLRLDQLLKYKADQGVQIYVLLYKEVEHIGQGNDSLKVKQKLESLHESNIHCIRHPNKFFGGATAVLWSHHEKLVVIDRNVAFVGGVDLAYQRWDDEKHSIADEDGVRFPGHDYRQPAPGKHKPARTEADAEAIKAMEEEEFIEVEMAMPDENLPEAAISTPDMDDEAYEVEVVVDFSLPENSLPPAPLRTATLTTEAQPRQASLPTTSGRGRASSAFDQKEESAPGEDKPDNLSDVSDNWAEDRFVEMTAEERQAAQSASRRDSDCSAIPSSVSRNSILDSLSSAATNVTSTLGTFTENASFMLQSYIGGIQTKKSLKSLSALEPRELYPRMGWHDIHCAINGRLARDVASHFVQRWNHHRLSTSSHANQPVMNDISDDIGFSVCAKCGKSGIHESATSCPTCKYDLGPPSSYSLPKSILYTPPDPTRFSYITFECHFTPTAKLPFRMEGDCPVVVTMLQPSAVLESCMLEAEGNLIDLCGPMSEWVHAVGLKPSIGDVILCIDGEMVTQLNSSQLRRLLAKKRRQIKSCGSEKQPNSLKVTFRRHYLEDLHDLLFKMDQMGFEGDVLSERERGELVAKGLIRPAPFPAPAIPPVPPNSPPLALVSSAAIPVAPLAIPAARSTDSLASKSMDDPSSQSVTGNDRNGYSAKGSRAAAALLMESEEAAVTPRSGENGNGAAPTAQTVDQFHPACLIAAQKEVQLSISRLVHECSREVEQVSRLIDDSGSCVVQLLRSVGKWSIGTKIENSILKCYIETIQNANHFIYIENQFFVGSLAGEGVQNGIPLALAERILKAYNLRQPFKVIVIIPLHPNGDMVNAMKSKVVMHYEYMTINRGMRSLFRMLRDRAPAINISEYIGFFSLRNWGVINSKVVSEQIYIHDKLMIVDDRIVIIGSANINDRSMLGNRDSEVAVRMEDTIHLESTFGGVPYTVGYLPHMLRNKLMRQHIGDESVDFSDPLRPELYKQWKSIAQHNSAIYDELDGNMSVYRCLTVQQYKQALETYVHRNIMDPIVQESLSEIRGFLVDWPQDLYRNEDLSPSLATRAIIPDELWV